MFPTPQSWWTELKCLMLLWWCIGPRDGDINGFFYLVLNRQEARFCRRQLFELDENNTWDDMFDMPRSKGATSACLSRQSDSRTDTECALSALSIDVAVPGTSVVLYRRKPASAHLCLVLLPLSTKKISNYRKSATILSLAVNRQEEFNGRDIIVFPGSPGTPAFNICDSYCSTPHLERGTHERDAFFRGVWALLNMCARINKSACITNCKAVT